MPAALSMRIRKEIVQRREAGEAFATIARDVDVYYGTVRNIWQHYQSTGELQPSYDNCALTDIRKDQGIYNRAIELKRHHPGWGAGLIWVEMADEFSEEQLPSVRTIQRWFHRAGLAKKTH